MAASVGQASGHGLGGSHEASVKVSARLCFDLKALLGEFLSTFIQAFGRADFLVGV